MSALARPTNEIARTPAEPRIPRHIASAVLILAATICVIAIVAGGSLLAYGRLQHGNSIFNGVGAAGLDLSGKSQSEAAALLAARFDDYAARPLSFQADGHSFTATPAELGATFDADATASRAFAFGRHQSLWQESRNWIDAIFGGHQVAPVVRLDPARFTATFDQNARVAASPPRDASFVQRSDGSIAIDPGASGLEIDVEATYQLVGERLTTLSGRPIDVVTTTIPQQVAGDRLTSALADASALAGHPLALVLHDTTWQIPAADLFQMLSVSDDGAGVHVAIDRALLGRSIATLESAVFAPGIDATLRNDSGSFTVTPAVAGQRLDIVASTDAAIATLQAGKTETQLVTLPVAANITDDEVIAAKTKAEALVAKPVTLTWDGGTLDLKSEQLAAAIQFDANAGRTPSVAVSLDSNLIGKFLSPVAEKVRVAGKNADLRWINGQVEVRAPEKNGRELDSDATVAAILSGVRAGSLQVAVVTKDVAPQMTAAMAGSVQIRDLLTSSATEYGSSAPARFHNVELAASRVNGALVPPGGTFSFNDAVGPVTYDSGYQTGYGILITNGSISTVPSVGGGICQVATTVFQSVFWAGMPVQERSWHLYWIPRYGQPPSGMKGLDATVDPDYALDFKFRNASDNWLAVKSSYDGSMLRFELWGTQTGWQVSAEQPVITDIVPATQEMHYEESAELPRGTSVYVEHAEDGFNAAIHRVVTKDGQVIDDMIFRSNYAPARNTTLVGTG
ncbi:MAG: peptidoglycan binding domain-containing protein [Thermomicrobiales bacterium]